MDFVEKLYHADISGTEVGDMKLFCCGSRNDAIDHRFGPAARDNYWFIYVKEGTGIYEVNRQQYRLDKNTVFIAFPNRRIFYKADPGSIWSIRWISIGAENLEPYLDKMNITEENPVIPVHSPLALENTLQSLLEEVPKETLASKFRCMGLVYQFLSLLTDSPAVRRDYLEEAIYYVYNNYDREISVADIAGSVRLDTTYFSKLFRKRMGVPPSVWLNSFRLEKAAVLLEKTDLKINEIARSVGFDDSLYFSRRFSEKYHCSPIEYRKSLSAVGNDQVHD